MTITHRRLVTENQKDFYPTPPYATRALFKYVIGDAWRSYSVWEPAAGRGDMLRVLEKYFLTVTASDIEDYGVGFSIKNFLTVPPEAVRTDWIITNPPFNLANEFIMQAQNIVQSGMAMFTRLQLMEGKGRFEKIFKNNPPNIIAPFVERVHLTKNKVVRNCGSTTAYAWFVWSKFSFGYTHGTQVRWIPPCRKELEQDADYDTE